MTITLELAPEIEARLISQARKRGLTLAAFIQLIIANQIASSNVSSSGPTADVKDLDIDVSLAAQALSFGPAPSDVVIATSNAKHLSQFVTAQNWSEILP